MSNPEAKTKAFRKSLKLVVTTNGQVTLYGQDITDALTENNYPLWFRMYSDTLAEYVNEDHRIEDCRKNELQLFEHLDIFAKIFEMSEKVQKTANKADTQREVRQRKADQTKQQNWVSAWDKKDTSSDATGTDDVAGLTSLSSSPYQTREGKLGPIQAKQSPVPRKHSMKPLIQAKQRSIPAKHTPVERQQKNDPEKSSKEATENVAEIDVIRLDNQAESTNAYYYYTSDGRFLGKSIDKNKKRAEVRIAIAYEEKGGNILISKSKFVYKDHTEFDNAAALVYGESFDKPEWFPLTAHSIINTQELRAHAQNTKGLPDAWKKKIDTSLTDIVNDAMGGTGHANIQAYKKANEWPSAPLNKKMQARVALIQALTRGKSKAGDGGLLDGKWHPQDPSKGATGWHGSLGTIGSPGNKYKTKAGFEKYWKEDYKESYGGENVIGFQPTFFGYNKNNIGTVYHKRSDEWIEAFQKGAGGLPVYQEAIKRGRGTFPHP